MTRSPLNKDKSDSGGPWRPTCAGHRATAPARRRRLQRLNGLAAAATGGAGAAVRLSLREASAQRLHLEGERRRELATAAARACGGRPRRPLSESGPARRPGWPSRVRAAPAAGSARAQLQRAQHVAQHRVGAARAVRRRRASGEAAPSALTSSAATWRASAALFRCPPPGRRRGRRRTALPRRFPCPSCCCCVGPTFSSLPGRRSRRRGGAVAAASHLARVPPLAARAASSSLSRASAAAAAFSAAPRAAGAGRWLAGRLRGGGELRRR